METNEVEVSEKEQGPSKEALKEILKTAQIEKQGVFEKFEPEIHLNQDDGSFSKLIIDFSYSADDTKKALRHLFNLADVGCTGEAQFDENGPKNGLPKRMRYIVERRQLDRLLKYLAQNLY